MKDSRHAHLTESPNNQSSAFRGERGRPARFLRSQEVRMKERRTGFLTRWPPIVDLLTLEARQIGLALLVFLDHLIHCQKRSPGRSFFAEDRGKDAID
jgi:hypothetical protein